MSDEKPPAEVIIAWSPIWVTLLFSFIQGVILFGFFQRQRNKDMARKNYDLFEPRQYTRAHRSPPAFDGGKGLFKWADAAWKVDDDECLRNVGLDAYMFLRFLRLSARMTLLGYVLSMILIPVYATGEARGASTEDFNQLTLARVSNGSPRLWATVGAWWIFCAFILMELWKEWKLYAKHRYEFLSQGDVDTPPEFRYAVRVENIPRSMQSNSALREYFEHLFPNQVRQVSLSLYASKLDGLIAERQKCIIGLEKAIAFTQAKPQKPAPMVKTGAKMGCCGGTKVDAIMHYNSEIKRLNSEIDSERSGLFALADKQGAENEKQEEDDTADTEPQQETDGKPSSTGYVTFTTLRAKQAALQCEISGQKDRMDTFHVAAPDSVVWENVTTPLTRQTLLQVATSCFWIVGILFWAVPVSFVTSIANLNGILEAIGVAPADPNAFWYGLVAGLLPVIALQVLMIVLYIAIKMVALKVIRKKSMAEVDTYAYFWHQLYQFANLWLILLGGSLFSQIDTLLDASDPTAIFGVIADAIPAASVFFMNLIIVGSFGAFGMELSMLVTKIVQIIMGFIQPEEARTQRMIDDAKTPPTIEWGKTLPKIVFVYFVSVMYMPIVPLVEAFAFIYFGGSYLVWKHQCLHVYATQFEGGGTTTWDKLFSFLIGAIYMSQFVFIAYMGIKEGPVQAGLGIVPLVLTIIMHFFLNRNIRNPLKNLSLEMAAKVDETDGEQPLDSEGGSFAATIESQLYGQPGLKLSEDEREPLPYRRGEAGDVEEQPLAAKDFDIEVDNEVEG